MVVLLRNFNQRGGHCNGTKYVVVNIKPHVLELRSVDTYNRGATILLPRIVSISKTKSLPFTLRRKQFPVKLAYGITANKVWCKSWLTFTGHIYRPRGRLWRWQDSTLAATFSLTARPTSPCPGLDTLPASRFLYAHIYCWWDHVMTGAEATRSWREGEANAYEKCGVQSCISVNTWPIICQIFLDHVVMILSYI